MEEELRSEIETLKDISEGAVPPEISIGEAKAILKQYKDLKRTNSDLQGEQEQLYDKLDKLEEENKKIKNSNDTLKSFVSRIFNNTFEKDFIPTSVIQNKIDKKQKQLELLKKELQGRQTNFVNKNIITGQIQVLQELLEERIK